MRKRKALKGGYKFSNPVMAGPFLKETLYRAKDDDIIGIDVSYNEKLKAAENDLNQFKQNLQEANKNYYQKQQDDLKQQKIDDNSSKVSNAQTKKSIIMVSNGTSAIVRGLWSILKYISSIVPFVIKTISNAGRGAIIKALLFIIFIILLIVGITKGISGLNSQRSSIPNFSEYGNSMFQLDTDSYLAMPSTDTIFSRTSEYINSLIPNEYKYNFGAISNSISYITTGKNQYEDYLTDRDETDQGRSDNIFHIHFEKEGNNYNKDYTFSTIKPKDVKLEFNENSYYNSDYNKIDSNFNAVINYPKTCIINIKNDANKYMLDLNPDNIKYYDKNNNIIANSNVITPIFTPANNGVKLNSFNNLLYSEYFNANKVLAAYAPKLINPNYKGPIIRLANSAKTNIIDFYNDYNDKKLYCIIDNKKIYYETYFKVSDVPSVRTLYDQSGNNNHFSYSSTALIRDPNLYIDDNGYYLHFDDRRILVSNPISSKNIKIYTKIRIKYEKSRLDAGDSKSMFFLYRKNEDKGINIKKIDDNNIAFTYNGQEISEKIPNSKFDNITMHYITTKDISNADGSDVILESLGNAEDIRSQIDRDINDIDGKKRKDDLDNHSLDANIYDLRIFKSDD